jgi:outer membrane receptor for ferrienterochelin and colicin
MKYLVLFFFLTCTLCPELSFAQTKGKISGTVVDASTGETLVGVNVFIEGTLIGKSTDLDGKYTIEVEPGTYVVVASYVSYTRKRIIDVEVLAGNVTKLDFQLESEALDLGEVTVSASAIRNNEVSLLRDRQKSISISDAISADAISRTGSGDAAEAMKKVTGASVIGGKYVFIRGLGDRYSSTQLNGSDLPSSDPNRKSFQLDLLPSSLLENIVTLKTFTPDKPGNFSGGLVNVGTKDFPDNFTFQASISSSYNTVVTGSQSILPLSSKTDWLGFDNGMRAIPEVLKNRAFIIPFESEARFNADKAKTLDEVSRLFRPEMSPDETTIPLNRSFSFALGNQITLLDRPLGFTASLSYNNSYDAYENGLAGRYQLIGQISPESSLTTLYDLSDNMGNNNVDIGGLLSSSFKISDLHKISATLLRTQSGSSSARYLSGFWDETPTGTYETRVLQYTERSLNSLQFRGKHSFPNLLDLGLDWNLSSSKNAQDEPDLRYFTSGYTIAENGDVNYSIASALYPRPARFFRDLTEDNLNITVDLTLPVRIRTTNTAKIKVGGYYQDINRDFTERRFEYRTGSRSPISYNSFAPDANAFFSNVGIANQQGSQFIFSNYITDASNIKNDYTAIMDIYAFYAMIEAPLTDKLRLVGGARFEDTYQKTASADSTLKAGINDDKDILPSVNFIYALNENMNFRVSYTNTLARPNFRELAPYATFDFVGDFVFSGNDSLKRTLIRNADFRWEWFPTAGEIISVSAFYKRMSNPIERAIRIDVNRSSTIQNVPSAEVYGLEFEIRKSLAQLGSFLRPFSVSSNLTFVRSVVDIPEGELFVIRQNDPKASSTRTLQGQSPFILNADLGYEHSELGLVGNLTFNLFGDRLQSVALGAAPDVFERSVPTLDLIARKRLLPGIDVSISAKNLLDPEYKISQILNDNEYKYQSFKRGRTLSIGLKYAL